MANLTGTLFTDLNGNGSIDIGESSTTLAGWQVYVDYNGNGTWDSGEAISAVTGANGQYTITGILNGTYKVRTKAPDSSWTVSIPDSPSDAFGAYRVIDFQTNGNFLNGVNFENANIPNPPPALADNASLTAANQKWSSLGFKFWLDNDKDFIPDVQPGEGGGTMFVEERAGAVRRTQAETELSAFVNDRLAGNFGDLNRLNRNGQVIYDVEDPTRYATAADGLGQYFLRGGGLYAPNNKTIPTLLIEYTTPTSAASGWIWDIDTTWIEQERGEYEQWRVEAFDANKNAIDIDPNSANTYIDSPIGESAWLLQNGVWVDNPNSLDARHWEWSFNLNDANVSFVRISYVGTKGVGVNGAAPFAGPEFVGLAFDRFQAFPGMPNFGAYQKATIGDYVWSDANSNGIQDSGEAAVAGVTVSLLDASGNPVRDSSNNPITTTTDANGKYSFNVAPGTYSVKFSNLPAGFTGFTTADVNGNGNDTEDSDANSSGLTSSVTVESGETNNTLDAGLVPESPQDLPASIGNFVWSDTNGNGIQDDGVNSGIAGITVNLKTAGTDGIIGNGDDTTISTQQTEADGSYLFDNLNPGSYYVEFVKPSTGYTGFTTPDAGADTVDSDANVLTGRTGLINLSSGENDLTVDAGLLPNQPASLGNFVWSDTDRDGVQDNGEAGIDGVTVKLLDSSGNFITSQVTSNGGAYLFSNLAVGDYIVEFVKPSAGYTGFTTPDAGADTVDSDANVLTGRTGLINLSSGENDLTVDAGLLPQLFLGDFVWLDSNGNGSQDGDETGIENVTVKLLDSSGNVIATTTTQANGSYQFPVNPGTYSVEFVPPTGYNFTSANQGNDALDSDANTTTGQTNQVIITTSSNNTLDAGLVPNGDLSITKTNNLTTVSAGQQITYTIEARNNGTVTATNALVSDMMPANLTNVSWTSQAFGGATGNQLSGTGSINDFVTLTGGSRIVYTVTGTVAAPTTTLGSAVSFSLTGNTSTSGSLDNTRTFTSSDNSVTVTARAFSRVDGTNGSWAAAYLGAYSSGLGVTDSGEGSGGNGTDRVDNVGGRDNYVVFQFSESVVLNRAFLDSVVCDSDISVWIGNTSSPLSSLSDSILSGLGFNEVNNTGSSSSRWADLNSGNRAGNTIVIAASTADTTPDDQFKIRCLEVNKVVPGVSALVNTATITAPNGFIDTNPDNNTSTDNDPIGTTTPTKLTIGDYVWKDGNENGLQDSGSQGVKCVTVKLLNSNNQVIATTQTNNSGYYSFLVDPGTYSLDFDAPSGYAFTRRDAGSNDAIDSDVDPLTGRTAQFTVTTANNLSLDAGLVCRPSEQCDEGFTPGYWRNNGITQGRWVATGYTTNSNYESVFGVTLNSGLKGSIGNGDQILTFLEALNANGNTDTQALLRHSTAGILNASHPDVAYYYSVGEVLAYTQAAFAGTMGTNAVKNLFETRNQAGGSF